MSVNPRLLTLNCGVDIKCLHYPQISQRKNWALQKSSRKLTLTKVNNLYFVLTFVYLPTLISVKILEKLTFFQGHYGKPRKEFRKTQPPL